MSTSSSLDDTPGTRAEHAPTKGPNSGASHSKAAFSGISEVEAQAVDPESLIKLTSSEGEEFAVPYKVVRDFSNLSRCALNYICRLIIVDQQEYPREESH